MQKQTISSFRYAEHYLRILAIIIISFISNAHACEELPNPREFPLADGKTATSDEMRINNKAVNDYVAAGKAFIECLEGLVESKEIDGYQARKLRNKTIDDMERLAALFNRQLRIFKRRN